MQQLMLEERVYEGVTPLCMPKRLQMKTQPVQKFAVLGAHVSTSCLQHISVSLEATVLSKRNQRALTWPSFYEAAGSSTHPLPQFSAGDCRTSIWTPASLHWSQFLPCSVSSTPNPALGMFRHNSEREVQHKDTRKCHRGPLKLSHGSDCCKTKPALDTDGLHKPWSYGS